MKQRPVQSSIVGTCSWRKVGWISSERSLTSPQDPFVLTDLEYGFVSFLSELLWIIPLEHFKRGFGIHDNDATALGLTITIVYSAKKGRPAPAAVPCGLITTDKP
ncbi:hypothetical protein J6590_028811 [Homalodisca vitripennis]|nr:hypothetical protein J6590_028811 [Homalodisca vitripennis]